MQEITEDHTDATILSAMINIGNSLKHRVIAEGVETRAQLKFLQQPRVRRRARLLFQPSGWGRAGQEAV